MSACTCSHIFIIIVCRCIKPNDVKSSEHFSVEKVLLQLKYTGVMETTRIRKEVCNIA